MTVALRRSVIVLSIASIPVWVAAHQGQGAGQAQGQTAQGQGAGRGQGGGRQVGAQQGVSFPGGRMNADDQSLIAAGASRNLFSQEAYTQYEILAPGTEQFAITYQLDSNRVGATTISNATRPGSEGTDVSVFDPRTGEPLKFTYEPQANGEHAIVATLPAPIPEGGIGRVLIFKTYKDARTYQMNGDELVWVRSLSGYRLGVVLPKGYAFTSSNVAAQMSTTASGQLKLSFASTNGGPNLLTVRAHKTAAAFQPSPFTDQFFDDIKTLYTLDAPETGKINVEQTYSDTRKGATAAINALDYMALTDLKITDLDTAQPLAPVKNGKATTVKLGVPITKDKQSAHLRVTGVISDGSYKLDKGDLVFDRVVKGLRNTVVLPAGYEVSAVSQSGTIGRTQDGRVFVALVNINGENSYRVTIRARK
jgi:hypothetical protein